MTNSGPFDIDKIRAILGPDGRVTAKSITPNFYAELDNEFDGFKGHVLISAFEFEDDWPTWEMHPTGDEIVYLLSGDTDFVLWAPDRETVVSINQPGHYLVVPKGVWHTARPRAKTSMLFVTPGEGTLNAEAPG